MNKRYLELVKLLNKYNHAYYVEDAPKVSDEEYDRLNRELKDFEKKGEVHKDSPSLKIYNDGKPEFTKMKHSNRMWSQDDVFNYEELSEWLSKRDITELVTEPKFDGLSLDLYYRNGELTKAITRGDGQVGDSVIEAALCIESIPKKIKTTHEVIEIHGEVVMPFKAFTALNKKAVKNNTKKFANPRNAASGTLRTKDLDVVRERNLEFHPWSLANARELGFETTWESMKYVYSLGFIRPKLKLLIKTINISRLFIVCDRFLKERATLPIGLDGIVIKANKFKEQDELGYGPKAPKWSCAYKFPAVEKQTTVKDIAYQVGRLGTITPVAEIEPMVLDGSLVSRATLSNFEDLARKDIRIGDSVTVIKSGDIIPKIIAVDTEARPPWVEKVIPPTVCPTCGTKLVKDNSYLRCPNFKCKDRVVESITYFASRDRMNIVGLGRSISEYLVDKELVTIPNDLYYLHQDRFKKDLEPLGPKIVRNLLKGIKDSKGKYVDEVIGSIGIPNVGKRVSKLIIDQVGWDFPIASQDELTDIKGVGVDIADSFIRATRSGVYKIDELLLLTKAKLREKDIPKSKYKVCISGSFRKNGKKLPRRNLIALLENIGLEVVNKMSSNVLFLLTGDNPSTDKIKYTEENDKPHIDFSDKEFVILSIKDSVRHFIK